MLDTDRIGVIDLGSNAIRLEVSGWSHGGHVALYADRERVRLGDDVFRSGRVERDNLLAAAHAVQQLAVEARDRGAAHLVVVATAAVREAENQAELLHEIEVRTGLRVEVLGGEEEAELLATAAREDREHAAPELLALDLGGGSTELTYLRNGHRVGSWSLPIGGLRLGARGEVSGDGRLDGDALLALERTVAQALAVIPTALITRELTVLGSSGGLRALARFIASEGAPIARADVRRAYLALAAMTREERAAHPHIDEHRADTLVVIAAITSGIMEHLHIARLAPTRKGLAAGVAIELRRKVTNIGEHPRRPRTLVARSVRHATALFEALHAPLGLDRSARRVLLRLAQPAGDERHGAADDREHTLAVAVRERLLARELPRGRRLRAELPRADRKLVKRLAAIASVALALELELGESLAYVDVALAGGLGLLILRTRELRRAPILDRSALRPLEVLLGAELALSAVPLVGIFGELEERA